MFQLGMPTLIEFDSLEENLELCKELDLDFIELNMNVPIFTPEYLSSLELKRQMEKYNKQFTIHLPEEIDLTSFQPSMRKGHIERCKETILWASSSGIKILNMHVNKGIYFTLPDLKYWINEKYEKEFLTIFLESYKEILLFADKYNVNICLENTCNYYLPFIKKGIELIKDLDGFNLTWDVGHDAKCHFKETNVFKELSKHVTHMHLHDFNETGDHQALYTGIVPINERLLFAKKRNLSVVLEIKTSEALVKSLKNIKENILLE
jgi:sugar phosphate isomerase/epimerase